MDPLTDANEPRNGRRYVPYRVALIVYCVFFAALILVSWRQFVLTHDVCRDGQLNRSAIRDALKRGFGNLGYRYDDELGRIVTTGLNGKQLVPLAYYRDHPDERERVRVQLERELEFFAPIDC